MNITLETQPNCRAVIHVEIPSSDVQRERDSVTTNYVRYAKLPGFRPGKAPKAVVAKKYQPQIREELEQALVRLGYQEAAKRNDVDILNVLNVKDQSLHQDESFTFSLEVSTVPKFELPEYKGIAVKLPRVEVGDDDVEHELLHLRERYQTFKDVERPAAIGDFAVVTAEGTVDGQLVADAFPEAPAFLKKMDGNWLELTEEESFLPGFFAALVGISKDEERSVTIEVPEDFPFEAARGKSLVFNVKCSGVKEKELPPLDEDFAKKVNPEWDLERLRTEVKAAVTQRRERSREEAKTNQVLEFLTERLEFELPQEAVNREAQRRTNEIASNALRQGMDQQAIMEAQEQIVSAATQQARQNVKVDFILSEIAKRENISVTEEQLRRALAQIAMQERIAPKKLLNDARKNGLIERLRADLLIQNSIQFLKEQAAIEEVEPEKEDCGHKH
ncbi:trigger factor [Phragmitibacter flavus]|uniref:Trigger factor n=1 Tax=Phragmitibacter flavus TaxID=2576071 RepID=A0A5R8KKH0_9BACT|nr:trigger factor [Phragmitibacter flavus]TLD72740.1 trigger factor [Phragmitibacter flavus]